ncbi:MAG: ATP/GTP-binding protein [Candidatus Coatesbacteria bacterium]|nr:MAG: ATP/GTP-binding protein [Candidatus Coatesbacteria bacterium]
MITVKTLITGDVGAGKTEFIRTVSDIDPVLIREKVTGGSTRLEPETAAAMDFGRVSLDDDLVLHLYGTTGLIRFDFIYDILSTGILGCVVLVDSTRLQTCPPTRRTVDFIEVVSDSPYVVVANKQDAEDAFSAEDIRYVLSVADDVPVLPCVARNKEQVKEVLYTLFDRTLVSAN